MRPGNEANYKRAISLASPQFGQLTFRFLTSKAISLLDLTNQLVALTFNNLPIIVG